MMKQKNKMSLLLLALVVFSTNACKEVTTADLKGVGAAGDSSNGGTSNTSGNQGDGGTVGSGLGNGAAQVPVIEMSNLKGGDFISGGQNFNILYTVHDDSLGFNESKVEYKRDSSSTWILIQDQIVSASHSEVTIPWAVCPQVGRPDCVGFTDGSGYRIRITAYGRDGLFAQEMSSTPFTIDGTPPVLASGGFTLKAGSPVNGFAQFQLTGATDSLTPVTSVCVKISAATPSAQDACWIQAGALGVIAGLSLPTLTITRYVGYTNSSFDYFLWVKDNAGNPTLMSSTAGKDKVSLTYTAPTYAVTARYWSDAATTLSFNTNATGATGLKTYTGAPTNNLTSISDPGSIVVNSKGHIYIKDKTLGIIRLNPLTQLRETILPRAASAVEGSAIASGVGRVKNPLRIALDANDGLWILDDGLLEYVDFRDATPLLKIVAGGGASTADALVNPLDLSITTTDNGRWYGTFAVLANGWVIFNSEDPHAKLNPSVGTRFRLRVYKHAVDPLDRRVESVMLSGSYDSSLVDDLVPFGPMAVSYDPLRSKIKDIYGRFCRESVDTNSCTEVVILNFNSGGIAQGSHAIQSTFTNEPMFIGGDTVYSINSSRGTVSSYDSGSNYWSKVLGGLSVGTAYCDNNTASTSCRVRVGDAFIDRNGQFYFIDGTRIRSIDFDGSIQTIY